MATPLLLEDLPPEILGHNLLSHLSIRDLESLGATSRQFRVLTRNEAFWRNKIKQDFALHLDLATVFAGGELEDGWVKRLWKALFNPVSFSHTLKLDSMVE